MRYTALLLSLWGLTAYAQTLADLLTQAPENRRIQASEYDIRKEEENLAYVKTAYYPRLQATALYKRKDEASAFEPKTATGYEVQTTLTLFDGFRREASLSSAKASIAAAQYNTLYETQNVMLEIVQAYYHYFDMQAQITALKDRQKALQSDQERLFVLVQNDLATSDTLKAIIASRQEARYDEATLQQYATQDLKTLELLTHQSISTLQYQDLGNFLPTTSQQRHDLARDLSTLESLTQTERYYTYYPSVTLQGTHRHIDFSDYNTMGGTNIQPLNQNELTASVSMTLFDMGAIAKEREKAHLTTMKVAKTIEYHQHALENEKTIAQLQLQTALTAHEAALSEKEARTEAFSFVKKRFEAGLVNATTYLVELANLTNAQAKERLAYHAIQRAKAQIAYNQGYDLMTLRLKDPS